MLAVLIGSFCLPLFSVLYLSVDKMRVSSIGSVVWLSRHVKSEAF